MSKISWILCSNRWNSAITEYALRTAQALKTQGWQAIVTALPNSHCQRRALDYGLAGPSSDFHFSLSSIRHLRDVGEALKPDVIVTFGGPETFISRFLHRPVVRFRGQDKDLSRPISRLEARINLGFCKGLLTPSRIVETRFRAVLPHKPIRAVALGLDTRDFHYRDKEQSRPVLLIVGRLDPIKGHHEFFKKFQALIEAWPKSKVHPFLRIIGQKSQISPEQLHERARTLGLLDQRDYEILDQRVPDLPIHMANATLGIIPSLGSEVIGRVTEEFLLCGTPVLIAPVGSLKECLVTPRMGAILSDSSLLEWLQRSWGESAEERKVRSQEAQKHFSLEAMGEQLVDYLQVILGTGTLDRR
jgi:glycosyltransferase involved in cell wall biosynthesis